MDSTLALVVGVALLFYFKDGIKSVASLFNNTIRKTADATDDTLGVYVSDVMVQNNKKRGAIKKEIEKASSGSTFTTQEELDRMINKTSTLLQDETLDNQPKIPSSTNNIPNGIPAEKSSENQS